MTESINFFQSMFSFKNTAPLNVSAEEVQMMASLKRKARRLAEQADAEIQNGRAAQELSFDASEPEKMRVFAEIAVWHFNRAADKCAQSAEKFVEAGKIQTGKQKAFNLMNKEMTRRAAEAAGNVKFLEDFLTQLKKQN